MLAILAVAVELRLPLTQAGHDKLVSAFAAGAPVTRRADSYFDAFDGNDFRLPLKLRLKGSDWQVREVLSRQRLEASGLWLDATRTRSWEGKPDARLPGAAADFFEKLSEPGAGLLPAAEAVADLLSRWDFPGKAAVDAALASLPPCRLYPSHESLKKRRSFDLPGIGKAKLGVTEALDESGAPVELYELEVDAPESAAPRLLAALARAGLTSADLGGPTPDAAAYTARRLRESRASAALRSLLAPQKP